MGNITFSGIRALCAVALLGLAAFAAALASPAAAQAVSEDFETPGLADGTKVGTQFESNGIYFTESQGDGIRLPEIDDDAPARSGSRTLDITTGPSGEEFPHPGLEARFTSVVTDATVHVRNLFTTPATVTLTAYRAGGGTVTDSATVPPGSWFALSAEAGTGSSFHRLQVNAGNPDGGKELRVDDVEFTVDPSAVPDFQLVAEAIGGVALPGQPKQYEVGIQRLNGFDKPVAFSGDVFGVFGESIDFEPDPTGSSGTSTTATVILPADAAADDSVTFRVEGSAEGASTKSIDIDFVIESPFRIEAVDPLPVRADRCATTAAAFRVVRNRFFSDPINVGVAPQSGSMPGDIDAAVAPATILSLGTVNPVTLDVTRGDDPDSSTPVPLQIVASSGGVERTLDFDLIRAVPRLTSVSPNTLFAPIALGGGSGVTVRGNGICPGASVQFGNDRARVRGDFSRSPTAGDPTRVQLTASTPRLATDGQVSVVNPSGTVIGGAGLPDADARSYRDRYGFSFPNEDGVWEDDNKDGKVDASDEPKPVGAGALRDWQELLGPHQTNLNGCEVGLFLPGCWEVITPIPTPQHLLMQTILGEASYYNRGGTCVGMAIASRRIDKGQATVRGRPAGAGTAPVWSLQREGRETILGRGDIPLEGRASYSPIKYAAIQHPAQTTAEYLELWAARRTINAVSGPGPMRGALEGHLRAGRRPLLNINWDGGGHAVNVYDIEDRPGGGYFIRVYDNNIPYMTSEAGDGATHMDWEERLSRIEVTPGGSWTYPGIRTQIGTDAAGNPIRGPRTGPTGDLSWIAVENELPVHPSSLAHLQGLRALATPGLSADVAAPANPAKAAKTGVMEFGYLDGEGSIVTAKSNRARRLPVRANGKGRTRVGVFGEGAVAEVRTSGSSAKRSARGGGDAVILPKGGTDGVGFKAGAGSTKVDLTLASEDSGRLVRVTGARGGTTQVKLVGKRDVVRIDHKGRPGRVRIELASFGRRDAAARLVTGMRLGAGAKVTLVPRWKRLGRKLLVKVNGRRRVLRNRTRPLVRVKRLRVGARKRGKRAVARVRARLVGRLAKLDTLVVGVEVRRGKKVVGRATRQLPPNRRSIGRLARRGIAIRPKLRSRRGRLRVRAVVSALVSKPLPNGSSRSASTRLR